MKLPLQVWALFLGIIGIGTTPSFAESGWFLQNPPPQDRGHVIGGVAALDPQTAVAVGAHGSVLRTNDGGATWTAHGGTADFWLNAVSFVDRDTGTAVGFDV